jgi:hypothetical protein
VSREERSAPVFTSAAPVRAQGSGGNYNPDDLDIPAFLRDRR